MANLVATPSEPRLGDAVSFAGDGFLGATKCVLSIDAAGFATEVVTDAAGFFGSADVADHATTTLTSSGVNVTAGDTVTINTTTYTFRAAPGAEANAVLIGASAAATLANLKKAINGIGIAGTDYGIGTVAHTTVFAGAVDATTLKLHAITGGIAANSFPSTKVAVTLSFPGATFNSGTPGTAATGVSSIIWRPVRIGTFSVQATDGTNTGSCVVHVWT